MDAPVTQSADTVTNFAQQGAAAATTVQATVTSFADYLLTYLLALAAVGALAMALIELWKKLRDTRTRYHVRAVTQWMVSMPDSTPDKRTAAKDMPPKPSAQAAYKELIHLTTGVSMDKAGSASASLIDQSGKLGGWNWLKDRPEFALYALELEKMMGHIQDAADIALSNPKLYSNLYFFMTDGADVDDVKEWYKSADAVPTGNKINRAKAKERAGLFSRLQQVTKRKLDAFQLYTSYRWGNRNILAANIVGIVVLFAVFVWLEFTNRVQMSYALIIPLSLLGGILSPVAKDIVVALRKVREDG